MREVVRGWAVLGALAAFVVASGATLAAAHASAEDPRASPAGLARAAVPAPAASSPLRLSPVRHVFILVLENQSFGVTFGKNSPAPYLANNLSAKGALLTQYYGIGHWSLDNYLALISGQAPNPETQADCPTVTNFRLSQSALDANGQALGTGCLYPPMVKTVADQLEAARLTWKGYMEDMGNNPARESATCGHVPPGAEERTGRATVNDKYAAKHDPFVYFHSIIDDQSRCDALVVNLDQLPTDLRSVATTPNYSFITPNLCNDGHDAQCVDGGPGGFQAIDAFLQKWVPLVMNSPAFKKDGLLIITFDESDSTGDDAATACCGAPALPGSDQLAGIVGPGGGRIGAVLLSPFIEPGTVSSVAYNHYSTLRYVEDIFGLAHLGYAGQKDLKVFGSDIFKRTTP
jgi:phosphatidylinositol-3-phosphatase